MIYRKAMKFYLELEPLPAPRPRIGYGSKAYMPSNSQNVKVYMPSNYRNYVDTAKALLKAEYKGEVIEVPVTLELVFKRSFKTHSKRFGDADNLAKGIMDAMNGVIYKDDSQVETLTVRKISSRDVGIEITINI